MPVSLLSFISDDSSLLYLLLPSPYPFFSGVVLDNPSLADLLVKTVDSGITLFGFDF